MKDFGEFYERLRKERERFPDPTKDPAELHRTVRRVLERSHRLSESLKPWKTAAGVVGKPGITAIVASVALFVASVALFVAARRNTSSASGLASHDQGSPSSIGHDSELVRALSALESEMLAEAKASEQMANLPRIPSEDRKYLEASIPRIYFDIDCIRDLKAVASRPGSGSPPETVGYARAKLMLAARLRSLHLAAGRNSARPVLVLNGAPISQTDSYSYAQGVIDKFEITPSARRRRSLDETTQAAVLKWVSDQPDQPWPDAIRAKLAEVAGSRSLPPIVIVVNNHFDSPDRSRGTLQAVVLDPDHQGHRHLTETEKFLDSHPLIDLFKYFRNLEGPGDVERKSDSNELTLTFVGNDRPFTMMMLNTGDEGLPLRDFCPSPLAEVVFEAKATIEGQGKPPEVQFGTGGDQAISSVSPYLPLGPDWQLITIPVELAHAERWKTGLTVTTHKIPANAKLTVSIRKAFIRPFGDEPRPAFPTDRGARSAANLPVTTITIPSRRI